MGFYHPNQLNNCREILGATEEGIPKPKKSRKFPDPPLDIQANTPPKFNIAPEK